tara:strand:+ start:1572 stop:3572 length:2001 start_codon:yes stop_codon:yes gene_type:complete
MGDKQTYLIEDKVYGRSINVTTDQEMDTELGNYYLKQTFGGKLKFDDLSTDNNYLTDLKAHHYKTSNEKITDKDLIEKEFQYWNMVDNNLTRGAYELFDDFANLDQKDAQRMLRRYDVYDRTSAFGEGSRDGWEQFKGVTAAMLTDPTNAAGGFGLFKMLATKLGSKGAMRFILTKIAGPAAIGSAYAGASNVENQQMKVQLGERENIDSDELTGAMKIGAVIGPAAGPAIGLASKAGKLINPKAYMRGAEASQKTVVETLGGAQVAQEGVVKEGKELLQKTGGHSSSSEAASAGLNDEMATIATKFKDDFIKLGELDVRPQHINDFLQKIYDSGIKPGKLADVEDAVRLMQQGKISPTDALRSIKSAIGNAAFDSNFKASTNILRRLKEEAEALWQRSATRSGKGKESAELNARYSDFLGIDKKIRGANTEVKVSNIIASVTSSPKKSATLIKQYLKELNSIGKHSGNENFVGDQLALLQSAMSEHLFKGTSSTFKKFVGTSSGRAALKQVYPDINTRTLENWAKILDNSSSHGGASTFWGRILAQSVGPIVGTAIGGATAGPMGAAIGSIIGFAGFAGILKSPKFQSMALKVYSKDTIKPRDLKRIEIYLIDKGMPESDAQLFVRNMAGLGITRAAAGEPETVVEQVNNMPIMNSLLNTSPAGQ